MPAIRCRRTGNFGRWRNTSRPRIFWDDQKYRGEAYAAFAWAVYVAEVAVDLSTYSVTVDDFVALQEVGQVLNPVLARGQIVGGVAQGIGFALYEKVVWRDGRMQNGQMTNYIMPTSADLPPIRVFFEEMGNVHGAYGAKGIGELPMDGPAPAIVNAIEDALGDSPGSILFRCLPEDIFEPSVPARSDEPLLRSPARRLCSRAQMRDCPHGEWRAENGARLIRWSGCWMCCGKNLG